MLVFSRKRNEEVMIGDDICLTIVEIRGDRVKLGFTAPRHVRIDRGEIRDRIDRERQAAREVLLSVDTSRNASDEAAFTI